MEAFIKSSKFFFMLSLGLFFILTMGQGFAQKKVVRNEIVVGTHLPLTGRQAAVGVEMKWAYENAVEDQNKAGGIYIRDYDQTFPIRLVIIDDQSSPSGSTEAVLTLIKKKKVNFILSGHAAVLGVIPGAIVADMNQTYYHATTCFIPTWKAHHFKWSTLLFYNMEESVKTPFELWNALPEKRRPKRVALIVENSYDAITLDKMFQEKAIQYKYPVVLNAKLSVDATDYSPQIMKAKELGVDAILLYGSITDTVTFIRQMKKHRLKVKYLHIWKGAFSSEFGRILGKDADYVVSDAHWSEDFSAKGARELGQRYRKEFGVGSMSVGMFYSLAQILWQAIEQAGILDSQSVRKAVLYGNFETVMGRINYGSDGVGPYPSFAFQWINGKPVIIYPFNRAKQSLQLPDN